uniref:Putative kunitz/bovine pancreatic trypsin inhibitor domain-containing protein n=1 Tax=Amblyomma americanum TaxID=6943 RepID=A0A0C9SE41_AMBAM
MNSYAASLLLVSAVAVFTVKCETLQCESKESNYWMCNNEKTSCLRRDFYYDNNTNSCQFLGFMGCGGNDNNFPSLPECVSHCRTTKKLPEYVFNYFRKRFPNCTMKSDPSSDNGGIRRFYYNSTSNKCLPVDVKNGDKYFPDMNICVNLCSADRTPLPRCNQQMDTGKEPKNWKCHADKHTRYTTCNKTVAAKQ